MTNESDPISIRFSDEFEKGLYALSKRYRNIRADIQPIIEQIQVGDFVGNRISGMGEDYVILKARVKNTNIQKGKSSGYRLIYQVKSATRVILLTIYSKSDREDIKNNEIIGILSEFYESDR
ncbi:MULTISPECIES: type II toxin-antitoxin system RelE family toxin [Kamptonema]|uniref:type II toxin-antitoxin system RelE/ParE family toxin n=1 Tax=Kamptonema TaxID=1501433 RepID=UPI000375D232|nr:MULTISPECIES: type II toxin-antitoxin system RelE/ParE family toxin [Kamptonema]